MSEYHFFPLILLAGQPPSSPSPRAAASNNDDDDDTMALLQYRKIVDYEEQQTAFEDFLVKFKTSPQETITHAIGQISIADEDLSDDEYDFMDEDDGAQEARRRAKEAQRQPRHKYVDMMQQLADRMLDEVLVELDDIASVSKMWPAHGASKDLLG